MIASWYMFGVLYCRLFSFSMAGCGWMWLDVVGCGWISWKQETRGAQCGMYIGVKPCPFVRGWIEHRRRRFVETLDR